MGIAVYAYDQKDTVNPVERWDTSAAFVGCCRLIRVCGGLPRSTRQAENLVWSQHGGTPYSLRRRHRRIDLCVVSGPPLKVSDDISPLLQKIAGFMGTITPKLPASKLDPDRVSRDPAVVRAYEQDPLVYHGMIPARSGQQLLNVGSEVLPQAHKIECPLLVLHGSEDCVAVPAGSEALVAQVSSTDKTKFYAGLLRSLMSQSRRQCEQTFETG